MVGFSFKLTHCWLTHGRGSVFLNGWKKWTLLQNLILEHDNITVFNDNYYGLRRRGTRRESCFLSKGRTNMSVSKIHLLSFEWLSKSPTFKSRYLCCALKWLCLYKKYSGVWVSSGHPTILFDNSLVLISLKRTPCRSPSSRKEKLQQDRHPKKYGQTGPNI